MIKVKKEGNWLHPEVVDVDEAFFILIRWFLQKGKHVHNKRLHKLKFILKLMQVSIFIQLIQEPLVQQQLTAASKSAAGEVTRAALPRAPTFLEPTRAQLGADSDNKQPRDHSK